MTTGSDVIYVGGTFDLFHHGHVRLFERAKDVADYVVAAVNSDLFTKTFKHYPVMREWERLSVVASCRYVDLFRHGAARPSASLHQVV